MRVDQSTIFAESEADRWFERNKDGLHRCDAGRDSVPRMMDLYGLTDGGRLMIEDFLPVNRTRVRYHHLSDREMFTCKQDYAVVFVASGPHRQACLATGGHGAERLTTDAAGQDRTATRLLEKRLDGQYAEGNVLS